jgi:hypothetical protein
MKKPSILDLRPTQFVLGMKEIESKNLKLQSLSKKELKEYTLDHEIPVVLGPKKEMYMIDHHHFARSCWEQNINDFSVTIIKDLSHKKEKDFWNFMIDKDWVYLHDQFGMGPHSPFALPVDIRCLADDPFRSLAWAVINEGYIKKQKVPFFEFKWAAFFRRNLDVSLHSKSNFKTAINLANRLARSKAAKNIPGFIE